MPEEQNSQPQDLPVAERLYPIPDHEAARLAALRALEVLDSPAERSFEDIVHLVFRV